MEGIWPWVVGILVPIVIGLISIIFYWLRTEIRDLRQEVKELRADQRHEDAILRHRVDHLERSEKDWRHKIYQPLISRVQVAISRLEEKVRQLERRKD